MYFGYFFQYVDLSIYFDSIFKKYAIKVYNKFKQHKVNLNLFDKKFLKSTIHLKTGISILNQKDQLVDSQKKL